MFPFPRDVPFSPRARRLQRALRASNSVRNILNDLEQKVVATERSRRIRVRKVGTLVFGNLVVPLHEARMRLKAVSGFLCDALERNGRVASEKVAEHGAFA